MKTAVIIGAGTQGQVYASYLKEAGINLIGFMDDNPDLLGKEVIGIPVLGKYTDLFLDEFKEKIQDVYCPIGINSVRIEYLSTLKKEGYGIPGFLHHTVSIAPDVILGEAVYMLAGNSVMPHTTIGNYVMINSGSTIAHHATLEDGVFMSSGVNIGALIHVKRNAYIGMGVTAMTGIKEIGEETLIGAGTVIIRDVPDYVVLAGNPGRVLRTKKPQGIVSDPNNPSDLTFIGSGISSSFTILQFLNKIKDQEVKRKITINVIDKYSEFHLGIPYGERSGFSVHLITSLKNFLPEPELGVFIEWLNKNKYWLLDEFRKEGGELAANWIDTHSERIQNNDWEPLFVPRRFFGKYLEEKITECISHAKQKGQIAINYIEAEAIDLDKNNGGYKIILKNKNIIYSKKVVLSVGSLPVRYLWKNAPLVEEEKLLFVNNPYQPELKKVLKKIDQFVSNRKNENTNVLIVGANASGLELLYKLNDVEGIASKINKFTVLSTQGLLPDAVPDEERMKTFVPNNLKALSNASSLTAKEIADATYKDLDYADEINLGPASTVGIISSAFGALLGKLDEEELRTFACRYGNDIGRRQRCAGFHYSKNIDQLKKEERFDHIAGRFVTINKADTNEYFLEYLDTASGTNMVSDVPVHLVINCVGSTNFSQEDVPELLANVVQKGFCKPNNSRIGIDVNEALEASDNLHIVGPLLAGNLLEGKAVWHVEHCGRIIWLSKLLSEQMHTYFFEK
ncbi:FAD/NAD(P)-binding protein [Aquimarina pacifica]|uniref:FAD/NAD(P)-binding protein n=1 Tax=Aquimarina pacifica TaxID=1296415 RepID=UPI0004712A86|nr:FAD/NAD(P)-binding protein [Aquimarina pacifica]